MTTGQISAKSPARRVAALATSAGVALCLAVAPPAAEQKPPTKEDLAKDNKLFLTLARQTLKWDVDGAGENRRAAVLRRDRRFELVPLRDEGGHILFNTGMPDSGPMIVESIRKLGFDPKDIKIMINGHGHPITPGRSPISRS